MKKRNREFFFILIEREKEEIGGGQVASFSNFHIFSLTPRLNVEKLRQWLDRRRGISQSIKRKTVAWKLDELNYHNIYFLAKLLGAGKNIFIFAGCLWMLASLCNYTLSCQRLQIIICKNNHKLYLPLVYYFYSQVLPQSPFQWTIILCHNSAVCLFIIWSQASLLFQFFFFKLLIEFSDKVVYLIFRCFIMSNFDSFINLS